MFENLQALPEDPILGLMAAFRADTAALKIDLGAAPAAPPRIWYSAQFDDVQTRYAYKASVARAAPRRILYSRTCGSYGNASALWHQHVRKAGPSA